VPPSCSGVQDEEDEAHRSRRWLQRGPGGAPSSDEVVRAARGRDRARCRSWTTQDEIHYSFFAALTILVSDSPTLPPSSLSLFLSFSSRPLRGPLNGALVVPVPPVFLWPHSREIEYVE